MTPAEKARSAAVSVEAKKDGLRQTQDGLWKLTLTIADLPAAILMAPMGTRFVAAFVQVNDDEEPVAPEPVAEQPAKTEAPKDRVKFRELRPSAQAAIIGAEPLFWQYLNGESPGQDVDDATGARAYILRYCGQLASRRELDVDDDAASSWRKLRDAYFRYKNEPMPD